MSKTTWAEYLDIPAMNPSTLMHGAKSMLALRRAIEGEKPEETPAMRFGQAYHTLVLEPSKFEDTHVVAPNFSTHPENVDKDGKSSTSGNTSWARSHRDAFYAENQGKAIVTREEFDRGLAMVEAVWAHPFARELVIRSDKEVTLTGEIDKVRCKGRVDLLGAGRPMEFLADLKGCQDVRPKIFGTMAARLLYPFKMAFYRELVRQNREGWDREPVYLIAVESADDFDVVVYRIPDPILDHWMDKVHGMLVHYKAAVRSDIWPGVAGGKDVLDLALPNWAQPASEPLDWEGVA